MARKRYTTPLLLGVVCMVITTGFAIHSVRSTLLLKKATARCSATGWLHDNGYAWINDSTILALAMDFHSGLQIEREDLRLHQHQTTPCPDFMPLSVGEIDGIDPDVQFDSFTSVPGLNIGSPGMLWEDGQSLHAMRAGTDKQIDLKSPSVQYQAVWSDVPGHVIISKEKRAGAVEISDISIDRPAVRHAIPPLRSPTGNLIGCFHHSAVFYDVDGGRPGLSRIYVCPLGDALHPLKEYVVSLPHEYHDYNVQVSPTTGRLLWTMLRRVRYQGNGHMEQLLTKLLHFKPHAELSLWDSSLDGSGFHRIGTISLAPGALLRSAWSPLGAAWLPNGRDASFVWK
jgi:hypothetical protein